MDAIRIKDAAAGKADGLGVRWIHEETRFNGKCKKCGRKASVLARSLDLGPARYDSFRQSHFTSVFHCETTGALYSPACHGDRFALVMECCGGTRMLVCKAVVGRYVAEKGCDGRCMAATGWLCDCSCGGRNHGGAHA